MASEVRDNRVQIRTETDGFLSSVPTSDYSQLNKVSFEAILSGVEAINTQSPSIYEKALSGARNAVLPMTVAIADRYNKKIQFTMLINPYTLNQSKTSAVYNTYTRKGYISQIWGSNQDLISGTGISAAFMVSGEGLTTIGRRRSFAYANMLAMLYAYRNNGYELVDPTALKTNLTRVINVIHGVELTYDSHLYLGHFNNFTLDEIADKPYLFNYNFEFVTSSLSGNYDEIKGHFIPIDFDFAAAEKDMASWENQGSTSITDPLSIPPRKEAKLVGDVKVELPLNYSEPRM